MAIIFQSLAIIDPSGIKDPSDFIFDEQNGLRELKGENIPADAVNIDCKGLYASQGWVDLKCFNGEPGLEYKEDLESLGQGLAKGGFVKAVLLPNTDPAIQTKSDVEFLKTRTKDFFSKIIIQGALTKDTKGEDFTEILDLANSGVKVFGDGLKPLANSDRLMKALQYLQKFDGIVFDHSYDPLLAIFGQMHEGEASTRLGMKGIPPLAEEVAIQKNIEILKYTGGRLHFQTVSTIKSVKLIREAKKEGLAVTADVSLYQLLFSDEDLATFDTNMKVKPPFRGESEREALLGGLKDGTIDAIVSNHRPHDFDAKHIEFDFAGHGMLGLQTFLPGLIQLEKELGWPLLIEKVTSGPNKVLGESEDNSLVIFDPKKKWKFNSKTNTSKSNNSPWFGKELTGQVKYLINRNKYIKINE
ncbi:dihydroorotase [Litoribacter ruber]|uniref:dihydroorotase n=1 Tax=Litoribacter ruber TaxID=702568 RepID=UPI001BDA9563|nr:dihydroorotase [Litoribacter ruber]MBT0811810.1 dihydroorotase [Litoribacter ruber]